MKIAAILPAYNEADRVADVVRAVRMARWIDEIIVVNDGSTDRTADVVRSLPGVMLVNLPTNRGKGAAMVAGVERTDADVVVFLDADLKGLRPDQVDALVAPVRSGRAEMSVGKFRGGRKLTDWSQRLAPNVSGQRAMLRDIFEQIPDIRQTRYGVEMAITRFCRYYRVRTTTVWLTGVTHPMKEEKLGLLRGWWARGKMYREILRILMDRRAPQRRRGRLPRVPRMPRALRGWAVIQARRGGAHGPSRWLYRQQLEWRRKQSGRFKG